MPRLLLALAPFFARLNLLIFPTAALVAAREWQVSYGHALMTALPLLAMAAFGRAPAMWLWHRAGRGTAMLVFWLGTGAACLLAATARSQLQLALALGLLGLMASAANPLGGTAQRASGRWSGRLVIGGLGSAAGILLTLLMQRHGGWRGAFEASGGTMLVIGMLSACFRRPEPRASASAKTSAAVPDEGWIQLRVLAAIATSALLGSLIAAALIVVLPKLFMERMSGRGLGFLGAGTIAGLIVGVAALASAPVDRLLERLGARRMLLLVELATAPLLLMLALGARSRTLLLVGPLVILVGAERSVASLLLRRHVAPTWRSRALALHYGLTLLAAVMAVPLIAWLDDANGSSSALLLVLAWASSILFASGFLLPARPRAGPLLQKTA